MPRQIISTQNAPSSRSIAKASGQGHTSTSLGRPASTHELGLWPVAVSKSRPGRPSRIARPSCTPEAQTSTMWLRSASYSLIRTISTA